MAASFAPPTSDEELDERLSRPNAETVRAAAALSGDLLILGAGGKMGPSLARLARRSADQAGRNDLRVIAVSRFATRSVAEELKRDGIETIACDLTSPAARRGLPNAPNVIYMVGHKFGGGSSDPNRAVADYWGLNTYLAGASAEQFRDARIVAFSTGNVYPFTRAGEPPPSEETPPQPIGEYALSCLGRERLFQFVSYRHRTPVCLLRLNYAAELRYGVPVDVAQDILAHRPIDLSVPRVNFVWQGYANAVALRALAHAQSPAEVLNVTGPETVRIRDLAEGLGRRLGVEPTFAAAEGKASLLSDATKCHQRYGLPELTADEMLDLVADWLKRGGRTLDKPTKFHVRDGIF